MVNIQERKNKSIHTICAPYTWYSTVLHVVPGLIKAAASWDFSVAAEWCKIIHMLLITSTSISNISCTLCLTKKVNNEKINKYKIKTREKVKYTPLRPNKRHSNNLFINTQSQRNKLTASLKPFQTGNRFSNNISSLLVFKPETRPALKRVRSNS